MIQNGGIPIKYKGNDGKEINSSPRESRKFNGREYVMETSIVGDFSLIKAWKGDAYGNLIFRNSAMNFNLAMAKAGILSTFISNHLITPFREDMYCRS